MVQAFAMWRDYAILAARLFEYLSTVFWCPRADWDVILVPWFGRLSLRALLLLFVRALRDGPAHISQIPHQCVDALPPTRQFSL